MCLVGDIGGTKTILALYEAEGNDWQCRKTARYASADYHQFSELLTLFLADVSAPIDAVCIGIAGPVINGDCITTNLPWVIKHKEIGRQTGTDKVWLLNDLEASAWGLLALPETDFVELNSSAKHQSDGNKAVVAAGTGLGEALMICYGDDYRIIATEGGHADFAPGDRQQIGLLDYLMDKLDGHVSYERVLSGSGLHAIYGYLKQSQFALELPDTALRIQKEDPAAVIGMLGVAGSDPLCVEALKIFCRIYGAEAGNLALKCLPYSGIYLTGGIAAKILPALQKGEFINSFINKGRSSSVIETISVKVCMNQEVGLHGALNFLQNRLAEQAH